MLVNWADIRFANPPVPIVLFRTACMPSLQAYQGEWVVGKD